MHRLSREDLHAANHGPARHDGPVPKKVVRQAVELEAHLRKVQPVIRKMQPVLRKASALTMAAPAKPCESRSRQAPIRRAPRRRGAGRPARRRTSRNTRAGPSDLDPPPRSPVALEGVAG